MVVEGEGFFGGLVIDHKLSNSRVRLEYSRQLEAKIPIEGSGLRHAVALDDVTI